MPNIGAVFNIGAPCERVDFVGNQKKNESSIVFLHHFRACCGRLSKSNKIHICDNGAMNAKSSSQLIEKMACRPGCGACCIAPSISSLNKPAGVLCSHLEADFSCRIFGHPERPACCAGLQPAMEMCGESRLYALHWLADLEARTCPG